MEPYYPVMPEQIRVCGYERIAVTGNVYFWHYLYAAGVRVFVQFSDLIEEDVYEAISLETCVNKRTIIGAPAPETVKKALDSLS